MEKMTEKRDWVLVQARPADCQRVCTLLKHGQAQLKALGVDQWQGDFPVRSDVMGSILNGETYFLLKAGRAEPVGTVRMLRVDDPTYAVIRGGAWLSDGRYATLHKIATAQDARGQGVGRQIFLEAERMAMAEGFDSLRVDTHEQNRPMRSLIERLGFAYCGVIQIADGTDRVAYEKCFDQSSEGSSFTV